MTDEYLHRRRSIQTKRIERIVTSLLGPQLYRITFVFYEDEISFKISGSNGDILAEAYRGTPVSEIEGMSDDQIEVKIRGLFANKQTANLST